MRWLLGALLLLTSCSGPEANVRSNDPYERYLGVRELTWQNDAESMSQIVKLLEDPHHLVVVGAMETLATRAGKDSFQHIAPLLKHAHPFVRSATCAVIASLQVDTGVPLLVEVLKDPEASVRRDAVKALASYGKRPDVVKPLVECVADRDAGVAFMAHEKLRDLTGLQDVPRTRDAWAKAIP